MSKQQGQQQITLEQTFEATAAKIGREWPLFGLKESTTEYEDGEQDYEIAITDQQDPPTTLLWHAEPCEEWSKDFALALLAIWNGAPSMLAECQRLREQNAFLENVAEQATKYMSVGDSFHAGVEAIWLNGLILYFVPMSPELASYLKERDGAVGTEEGQR